MRNIFLLICIPFVLLSCNTPQDIGLRIQESEQIYISDNLLTDTSIASISLEEILDGGPGKDGIPSIDDPEFVTVDDQTNEYLSDDSQGILVQIGDTKRWYPYNILNWHEIVNDSIGDTYFAVTFCPLCGSAIVYDREISSGITTFGVSGKLHNSNLLMYDRDSESLWSQSRGESVVGNKTSEKLQILDADLVTWSELNEFYSDAQVLSINTGANRRYEVTSPYGSYDTNEQLYFPVANIPEANLPIKEMLYIANLPDGTSIAYVISDLRDVGVATIVIGDKNYTAIYEDGSYAIEQDGHFILPGYFEMWFSWAVKQDEELYLWQGE